MMFKKFGNLYAVGDANEWSSKHRGVAVSKLARLRLRGQNWLGTDDLRVLPPRRDQEAQTSMQLQRGTDVMCEGKHLNRTEHWITPQHFASIRRLAQVIHIYRIQEEAKVSCYMPLIAKVN